MARPVDILVADANVLIDYRDSCLSLLRLISLRIAPVRAIRQVLSQIDLRDHDYAALGIEIVDVETSTLVEASHLSPTIGFEEALCFLVCRELGWTCVTNDHALRAFCGPAGIRVVRGLDLLIDLVRRGSLAPERASAIAQAMQAKNPAQISSQVLQDFNVQLQLSERTRTRAG